MDDTIPDAPITSKTLKQIKSKTVTKKSNNNTTDACNNPPSCPTITNIKKRKLDFDTINNDKKEPNNKKRKLNTLIEANQLLQQQNYELKQANKKLLKQRNHYKDAYRKVCAQLCQRDDAMNNIIDITESECDIEIEIKDHNKTNKQSKITPSPTPPPSKYFHKRRHTKCTNNNSYNASIIAINNVAQQSHSSINQSNIQPNNKEYDSIRDRLLNMGFDQHNVTNRIALYNGSGENAEFVFNQLIHTFASNNCNTDTSHIKFEQLPISMTNTMEIKKPDDKEREYVPFEDSYYISVDCHVCEQHFDNAHQYKTHLQQHYNNDATKTWLQCDFGCKHIRLDNSWHFIRHISTHTHDKPYKCNITNNGTQCRASKGTTSEMKQHWKTHFDIIQKSKKRTKRNGKKNILTSQKKSDYVAFEDSYHVSVDCHICKQHFNDFNKYAVHLEAHYHNDPNKTWRKCDLGCELNRRKTVFVCNISFISHIAQQHTKQKPFGCDVVINGTKCQSLLCSKSRVKQHWKKHWNLKQPKLKKAIKPRKKSKKEDINFERSYYISVNCHICKLHFDDFHEYRHHIEQHYNTNPLKTWLCCDFGCNDKGQTSSTVSSGAVPFIQHIASHTKQYPYRCGVVVDGVECGSNAGTKGNLKQHWNCWHNFNKCEESAEESTSGSSAESEYDSDYSDSDSSSSGSGSDSSEAGTGSNSDGAEPVKNTQDVDFESSYYVAVNCHICKRYFDDFDGYTKHVEQHYDNDAKKKWLQCDFGCVKNGMPVVSSYHGNFMTHIAKHTKAKPFKCNVFANGVKCTTSLTSKVNLRRHWEAIHLGIKRSKTRGRILR